MNLEMILFVVLALTAAISSIAVITRRNPVYSALFLILNFFALAGIYLLLNAQFIAVVQVIVYAGAIMVLFLFVIMLLNTEKEIPTFSQSKWIKIFAVVIGVFVFLQIAFLIFKSEPSALITSNPDAALEAGTIEKVGSDLYTMYIIPFEAAGFLLLAATIGALILAKKKFE